MSSAGSSISIRDSNNQQRNTATNFTNSFNPHTYSSSRSSNHRSSSVSSRSPRVAALTPFAGLPNIGNTCYMNALFQIIAALYKEKVQHNPLKDLMNKINDGTKPLSWQVMLGFIKEILNKMNINEYSWLNNQQDVAEFITLLDNSYKFLDPIISASRTIINAKLPEKNQPVLLQKEKIEPDQPIFLVHFTQERSDANQASDLSTMIALNNEEFLKNGLEVDRTEYSELEGTTNESDFFRKKKDELVSIIPSNDKKEKKLLLSLSNTYMIKKRCLLRYVYS